ncbi:hypothetical protein EGI31_13790, partial [Lacihabitans soyangensis]|nr:hypothetical protein [Lacihabitans soyangensis]
MKKLLLSILVLAGISASAQVKVGDNPTVINPNAVLEMESTTKGLLLPRMTTAQRTAIVAPTAGLQVYDTDTKTNWFHNGTIWVNTNVTSGSKWTNDPTNTEVKLTNLSDGTTARPAESGFLIKDNGNVGIGTLTPAARLQVVDSVWNKDAALFNKVVAETDEWPGALALRASSKASDATFHKGIFSMKGSINTSGTGSFIKASNIELGNNNNGATVGEAYGVTISNRNISGIVKKSVGFGVGFVQATGADAANPHEAYGIFIDSLITASGGSTNNAYAIYSRSKLPSYLEGSVTSNDFIQSNVGIYGPKLALIQYGGTVVPG